MERSRRHCFPFGARSDALSKALEESEDEWNDDLLERSDLNRKFDELFWKLENEGFIDGEYERPPEQCEPR
jgi:hypothetical protein